VVSAFYKPPHKVNRYNDDDSTAGAPGGAIRDLVGGSMGRNKNKSVDFGGSKSDMMAITSEGKPKV